MKIKRPNKREIVIAVVFLLIGFLLSFVLSKNSKSAKYKSAASEIGEICISSVKTQSELYDVCNERYSSFYNCVADLENCKFDEVTKKGEEYRDKEKEIGDRIEGQTQKLKDLIEKVKEI